MLRIANIPEPEHYVRRDGRKRTCRRSVPFLSLYLLAVNSLRDMISDERRDSSSSTSNSSATFFPLCCSLRRHCSCYRYITIRKPLPWQGLTTPRSSRQEGPGISVASFASLCRGVARLAHSEWNVTVFDHMLDLPSH